MKKITRYLLALFVSMLANIAFAEVFCVDTAEEIQAALTSAASNAEDDEVQIVQGTHVGNFFYISSESRNLSVSGGFTLGCNSQLANPENTILDGANKGGVFTISVANESSQILIYGVSIRNGLRSSGNGGGLFVNLEGADSNVIVRKSEFVNNRTNPSNAFSGGGGGSYINASRATLSNCSFIKNNSGEGQGGGLLVDAELTLNESYFSTNESAYHGGGLFVIGNIIDVTGSIFIYNSSGIFKYGGGIYARGSNIRLANNVIANNSSPDGGGGGVFTSSSLLNLTNNTIIYNRLAGPFGNGISGGVYVEAGNAYFYNNIFFSNQLDDIWIDNDPDGDYFGTSIELLNNNFNYLGFYSTIPITIHSSNYNNADPLFENISGGNFNLQPGSPMINAGYPNTPDLPATDIEGNPRIIGGRVDIGAHEYDDGTRYNLTTSLQGNGFGRVTSNPAGIDCGNDCDDPFPPLNNVVLTGTPDNGSTFAGWSGGGCSGTAPCTVKMDADKTVTASFTLSGSGEPALNAAVLPYARAIGMGETATAFGTLINSGTLTATSCALALPAGIPATFSYQTTDAGNALSGSPNTPVSIPAGAVQQFVFGITPTATFAATEIPVVFDCTNSAPAPSHTGVNTFILSASSSVPADLVAIASTVNNDGIVHLDPGSGIGFFATAAVNIGSTGTIQVQADDGERVLPLTLEICETTASGQRIGSCASRLTRTVNADETVYYTVNVFASQGVEIPFDPAFNRLYLRFVENGTTVGATNVAVTTE